MRTLAKLSALEDFVKEAITAQEHQEALANEIAKARELAKARGVRMPHRQVVEPTQEMYMKFLREEARRAKAMGDTAHYKSIMQEMKKPTQQFAAAPKTRRVPAVEQARLGVRQKGVPGTVPSASPLREAEIVKARNPYAESTPLRLKHRWWNPAKRFMKTTPGKALGIGALGAAGLGLYSYLKNRQTPQPMDYQISPQEQSMMQSQMYPSPYAKMGAMTGPSTVPTPPPLPRVSSPGPAVGNLPTIQRDKPTAMGKDLQPSPKPGTDAMGKKADMDPSLGTLLAGGLGGGAGYLAGKHLVNPLIENKERSILREIAERQKSLENWQTVRKYSPIAIAALGAVALASLAAMKARKDEREKANAYQMLQGRLHAYDPTGAGYGAADQVPMGAPFEQVYG